MPRSYTVVVVVAVAVWVTFAATPAHAVCSVFDRRPCAATVCSVFDRHPCVPTVCSVFSRRPCAPEPLYPIGQDLRLTIESSKLADYVRPDHDLDSITDLFAALQACWQPPALEEARTGMQMSVRLSFKRSGEVIAAPRLTYATPGVSGQTRQLYRDAISEALARCAPMPFTNGLGRAIAGRPIAIRYVDDREAHP